MAELPVSAAATNLVPCDRDIARERGVNGELRGGDAVERPSATGVRVSPAGGR